MQISRIEINERLNEFKEMLENKESIEYLDNLKILLYGSTNQDRRKSIYKACGKASKDEFATTEIKSNEFDSNKKFNITYPATDIVQIEQQQIKVAIILKSMGWIVT